jgi:RNA polymerase sigma-70 factor (ECF subfamily)
VSNSRQITQHGPAASTEHEAELAVLISQTARGDQQAYGQFYDRTASAVLGMVLGVIRDREQSEQVMQDVMVEAWRTASRFDPGQGSAMSWLMTLAHRRAVACVRAEQPAGERKHRATAAQIGDDDPSWGTETTLEAGRVRRCLGTLTHEQRESVTLAYYGGYSYLEVGALLGVPASTVRTRLRDALIRIRDGLGAEG